MVGVQDKSVRSSHEKLNVSPPTNRLGRHSFAQPDEAALP